MMQYEKSKILWLKLQICLSTRERGEVQVVTSLFDESDEA